MEISYAHFEIFVYGTLMREECNHHWLKRASFVRAAKTVKAYALIDLGGYPGMISGDYTVFGELFRVDTSLLLQLDQLEEHPDYYARSWITLACGQRCLSYLFVDFEDLPQPFEVFDNWKTYRRQKYGKFNTLYQGESCIND